MASNDSDKTRSLTRFSSLQLIINYIHKPTYVSLFDQVTPMEPLASKKSLIVNAVSEDIWRVIGSHLHTPDLVRLMGVNRALLNIALDTRYREVHWVALNKSTIWYLDRLQ